MAFAPPKLDDRNFEDIVNEAIQKIPYYCKEWTDHNLSDPGITLIELFAWMTDILLYRLNQVPDLHYVKFLELLGIHLSEPEPAKVPVTFWLSAPQPRGVIIPAGTEVASLQTETERSIVFTTDTDFSIEPPDLQAVISRRVSGSDDKQHNQLLNLRSLVAGLGKEVEIFTSVPQTGDALFFGFKNDLSHHILNFEMDFNPAGGRGIVPDKPPYVWEASSGAHEAKWLACDVEEDTTLGMNSVGRIQIHLPEMGKARITEDECYWTRVKIIDRPITSKSEQASKYTKSPLLRKLAVTSAGGTIPATHAQQIRREFLGQSDGLPGQKFYLQMTPILKRKPGEGLTVHVEGEAPQTWIEVDDFSTSGANDRHYVLDSVSGELRFGPAIRQPDGTIKLYGGIPPGKANLIFEKYRSGGGEQGNIQAEVLNTLKTALPYIAKVTNREPAWGGLDAETLDAAKMRAPAVLHSRERAVTEADFELHARQALPAVIGRVKCLQPRPSEAGDVIPGHVYILVIPRVSYPQGLLREDQLSLKEEDKQTLTAYLDERRLLTTQLIISPPAYQGVAVYVKLRAAPGIDKTLVESDVLKRLYSFLNPLTGGQNGNGWPFGRDLFVSDVYQCLQGIPNIQFIRCVEMYKAEPGGKASGNLVESIEVISHGVIVSGIHQVEFV